MVKVIGPLASHHASGHISAPRIYSSSLRNRHERKAPPAPPAPTGFSLHFTSTSDHCDAPSFNHPTQNPGTLETWIYPTAAKGYLCGSMFTTYTCGAYLIFYTDRFYVQTNFGDTTYYFHIINPIPLNQWTHVASTWATGLLTMWIGGQNIGTSWTQATTTVPYSGFHIGGQLAGTQPKLEGYITRTRFSDIVRYNAAFTPPKDFTPDANTLGLWRMMEGSGITVADESGNGHTLNFPGANQPTWSTSNPD